MLYGAISFPNCIESPKNLFLLLKGNLNWNGGVGYSFQSGNFFYGFFLNPKLPITPDDIYFVSPNDDFIILISGKIYNLDALRKELGLREEKQPEFVWKAYNFWGTDFVANLNGDFVICIFNKKSNELLIFRDHLGIKPLGYTIYSGQFVFSSDITSICKAFYNKGNLNFDYLLAGWKYVNHLVSPCLQAKKLPPGHYLKLSEGKLSVKKYWFPEKIKINKKIKYDEAINTLSQLVDDAIKIRSSPYYYSGAHLSGGLDSSLIAVKARAHYQNQQTFPGFSYAPENLEDKEINFDERQYVKEVGNLFSIKPIFSELNEKEYLEIINDYYLNFGSIWEEKVRENAKKENVNLIFSGWGGDEFLSKSWAGVDSDLLWGLKWKLFIKRNSFLDIKNFIKTLVFRVMLPALGIINPRALKEIKKMNRYFNKEYQKSERKELSNYFQYYSRRDRHIKALKTYHLSERCEKWDIRGFKLGIEYRYPFLDKRIIEFILQIPSEYFIHGKQNRYLIREISKGILPESVRLNNSKLDNAFISSSNKMLEKVSEKLISEIAEWKKNRDLASIINFHLLEKDLKKEKEDLEKNKYEYLPRQIVFIKMLHEFTKTYRSLPPTAE
jgi:asparagine synthase (glutamine-hydrolysing)